MEEFLTISREIAATLAANCADDPAAELKTWLRIALEREGMVSKLYGSKAGGGRLEALGPETLTAAQGVWADEEGHAAYLRAVQNVKSMKGQKPFLTKLWGALQGVVMAHATGDDPLAQALAKLVMRVGARSSQERRAAKAIREFNPCEFCAFSHILEITAVEGYERMLQLLERVTPPPLDYGLDLKLLFVLSQERSHRDLFGALWFRNQCEPPDSPRSGRIADGIDPRVLPVILQSRTVADACRHVLAFHLGAASGVERSRDADELLATDYWRWRIDHPNAVSYLVEGQGLALASPGARVVFMGGGGLAALIPGAEVVELDASIIERFRGTPRMFTAGEGLLPVGFANEPVVDEPVAKDREDVPDGGWEHGA